MSYDIRYTQPAKDFADKNGGLLELEATVKAEVENLYERGLAEIWDLGIHIFSWKGKSNMIMAPYKPDLVVDVNDDEDPDEGEFSPPPGSDPEILPTAA